MRRWTDRAFTFLKTRTSCWGAAWRRAAVDLLFPPRCLHCDADLAAITDDLLLCEDCKVRLGPEVRPCCQRCGAAAPADCPAPERCPRCHGTALRFDAVVALGAYRNELRHAVLRMKQPEGDPLSGAVAGLLWVRRSAELTRLAADLIVPIPMHWARRFQRGTNSPERVAAVLGRRLKRPVAYRLLRWRRKTKLQSELPPKERFRNVRDAFRTARGRGVEGARILLIDDVLTTGATCSEAARTLKLAGASMVGAAVVARAEGNP